MTAYRCVVTGRVQGVGFRYWVAAIAGELGLEGWVRNLPDGTVELMIQGDESVVEAMVERIGQGPSQARVEGVSVIRVAPFVGMGRFDIRF